ncbi:hypothetical protein B0T10DRAFT_85386 [Thelonectria olida]|uniref:Zn(2)-C6 fungal-type domain-containing protein n=1 Tax=Thelonectria olida TaxID=1576542 RepID=A0A9P9AQ90_9HYPO|nr:hypothetical protein B0T10DRAFT_85386 [Thelonectria olida]
MSTQEGRPAKVLSCSSCRHRKIKCDKAQPLCTQCSRFGFECVYPSRKPTRRAPRPRQTELMDRISRLENIVGQADPAKLRQLEQELKSINSNVDVPSKQETTTATTATTTQEPETQGSPSQPVPRYLSGEFWGHLCAEVEGIRQALDQPSDDDDDDDDDDGTSPESIEAANSFMPSGPSGFLFGNPDYQEREPLIHPPPDMMARLWAIYLRNVDPLMKVLHRPTITKALQNYTEPPIRRPFEASTNAVIFAIYFCAVTSLTPEDCLRRLGESYDVVTRRYRNGIEQALAEADYLNSNELETLQALALYTSMIRCYSHNRSSWALTALLIRLAQGQGLHRDGHGKRFTPFIAEMRRRLWYFCVVLDIRGSEDRGSDAILSYPGYNTIMPTPIDDDDFGPDSIGPLAPKESGPADNVILMCTAKCSSIFGHMAHPPDSAAEAAHVTYTEKDLVTHIRQLEEGFIHTAVPGHLPSMYASEISRLVILKIWLNIQYPFTENVAPVRPRVSRETMLRTALSVMELRYRMTQREWQMRFAWWTDTYVQWHPLAVALAELCVQTEGELVDRAWEVVDQNFPKSRENIADYAQGALWRPIKKLLKKAKAARAEALMGKLSINETPINETLTNGIVTNETPITALPPPESIPLPAPEPIPDPFTNPGFQDSLGFLPDTFDSTTMDPSILFNYPPELLMMDMGPEIGQEGPVEWSLWNEFLNDTRKDNSPGSGAAESV